MTPERISEELANAISILDIAAAWSDDPDVTGLVSGVSDKLNALKLQIELDVMRAEKRVAA